MAEPMTNAPKALKASSTMIHWGLLAHATAPACT